MGIGYDSGMDVEQLRQDVARGDLTADQLVEFIAAQQTLVEQLQAQIEKLRAEVERLQKELGKNPTARLDEAYSEKAEEERQAKATGKKKSKSKPKRRGRVSTADKISRAERTEQVFPDDCEPSLCRLSHTRVAWRLEQGRAVLIAYEIYRQGNQFGQPAGLPGRGEFGMEVLIALAYQVYTLGLSLDKACQVLGFFQGLNLRKSQANALLNQLSRQWENEFDTLCMLLANAAVVYTDETSWSINSVWAFLTDHITVMFYGVHKDGQTLEQILDKSQFAGVLVSDNAAVYQNFTKAQKCWAHLLRKAIKLTLQDPQNKSYRDFADSLLAIYRAAKKVVADRRFKDAGRANRAVDFNNDVLDLCSRYFSSADTATSDANTTDSLAEDFRRLVNEITRLLIADELFVFVTTPGVAGNNNGSERELRDDAQRRDTGRTNKTPSGGKRQTIITSILRSLSKQLREFTLGSVIAEIQRWAVCGRSCFSDLATACGLDRPPTADPGESLLDRILLNVDIPLHPA